MKIETATTEQWQEVERIKQSTIASVTEQYSHSGIAAVVRDMWSAMGHTQPITLIAPSPLAMMVWIVQLAIEPMTLDRIFRDDD